jgi:hypothetical protein
VRVVKLEEGLVKRTAEGPPVYFMTRQSAERLSSFTHPHAARSPFKNDPQLLNQLPGDLLFH